ncbi:MAG TPA: hypothetical protein VIV60_32820 [Polyangiaceae bacterium]
MIWKVDQVSGLRQCLPAGHWVAVCYLFAACLSNRPSHAAPVALGSLPEQLELGENTAETYELNAIGFVHQRMTKISLIGIPIVRSDTWWPVVGKYRYGIDREEFLLRVGRDDLSERQSATDKLSNGLFYGGFAVALSGIVLPFLLQNDDGVTTTGLVLGAGVFLGGVVISNVGTAISGPVIEKDAAQALAMRYNAALAQRLHRNAVLYPNERSTFKTQGLTLAVRF